MDRDVLEWWLLLRAALVEGAISASGRAEYDALTIHIWSFSPDIHDAANVLNHPPAPGVYDYPASRVRHLLRRYFWGETTPAASLRLGVSPQVWTSMGRTNQHKHEVG